MSLFGAFQPALADFTAITGTRAVSLDVDGTCTPHHPGTEFNFDVTITTDASTKMYLIDGNGYIMDSINSGTRTNYDLSGFGFRTADTAVNGVPQPGPYAIIFSQDEQPQDQGAGSTYVNNNGEFERITFNPGLFDPDCPNSDATTDNGPSADDKSNIVAGLQQSFDAATPGLLESLPTGNIESAGSAGTSGLSFAPRGNAQRGTGVPFGDLLSPNLKTNGVGFAPDANAAGNSSFDFNLDLQQMAAHMAASKARTLAPTRAGKTNGVAAYAPGDALGAPQSRWLTSLSGRYVDFDDDQSGADRSGDMWLVNSALGYRLNDKITAGVLTRYRAGKVESTAATAKLDSTLYGGGAFITSTGPGGVTLSGAALYEFGTNDVTISGDSGSFDSSAVTVEGKIDKRFTSETNNHWLEPAVNILYLKSDSDDYTDSAGVRVSGQSQTLGRLTFGPKIGTTITATNPDGGQTIYSPYASIKGIWDFAHPDDLTTSSGVTFTSAETGLTLAGGVDVALADGLNMHLSGDWITYNTKLQVWSVSSGMEASFAALGLGNQIPGLVALNFTGNTEAAQSEAKVTIPLQ